MDTYGIAWCIWSENIWYYVEHEWDGYEFRARA